MGPVLEAFGFGTAAALLLIAIGRPAIRRAVARAAAAQRAAWEQSHPGMSWEDWQARKKGPDQ